MSSEISTLKNLLFLVFTLFVVTTLTAQVAVGNGSYTGNFPGTDSAGRNAFPGGTPQVSGAAASKPVPTNDWWSKIVYDGAGHNGQADNLFNYPLSMKTTTKGLAMTYIPWGVFGTNDVDFSIEIGLTGMTTNKTTVSDFSDWTVTMNWNDGTNEMEAISGIGMPFIYFTKNSSASASIKVYQGTATISGEMLLVENGRSGSDYVVYAPTGSTWSQSGSTYTSTLNGKDYWSVVMLPQSNTSVSTVANEYKKFAYVFPSNTEANWSFNESTSKVTTTFTVTTDIKEGTGTNVLMGLLPHQWGNLAPGSASPNGYSYDNVRGEIKTLDGNSFSVENTFRGILPTMPNLQQYSPTFKPQDLNSKINLLQNEGLATWTDSYNEGQVMNRLIQTARIADQTGNIAARDKMIATIKERLEDWLSYENGEVAFLFYLNTDWSSLIGYPAGHGQDSNINDHHFHWGYFIHAASFLEQFEPGWVNQWGPMVNLLVRDASSPDRNDSMFPFLRNFSPYAGHSWANGFASFPQGNDQESTSESMQFASSLIHWGTITENDEIRDLGIYIYTTEQTAIEEYWFDMNDRVFQQGQQYSMVSRVWGNSYDNGTFWTSDITASYVIELYPMHGGSLYLGQDTNYVQTVWNELKQYTGILDPDDTNPNLWHDTIWKYLSFLDPDEAISLYNSDQDRTLKFGVSDAQTYHWLHAMKALGKIDATVTADYPIAAVFNDNGTKTYVAHNYSDSQKTVTFSDGFQLVVPANQMATSRDINISGTLSSNKNAIGANETVDLTLNTSGSGITKVEFYDDNGLLGEDTTAPYSFTTQALAADIYNIVAKIYTGSSFVYSNVVEIQVGDQKPFGDVAHAVPGTIEAAHFDYFEGGLGQNISYFDTSVGNNGDFRASEYVDSQAVTNEGNTVGWIAAGEWLEYTISVQSTGCYTVNMRYASGNSNGGGPMHFEVDGQKVSEDIVFGSTGDWGAFNSKSANVELTQGTHVLKLVVGQGEFNLGRMEFSYNGTSCPTPQGSGLPFDFETTPTTNDFNNFDGGTATVVDVSGAQANGNSSTKMAKIVRDGGQSWAGAYLNLAAPLNFTTGKYITLKVWTEAPIGTSMQMKLERQSGGGSFDLATPTTVTGDWETLYWDFSSQGASTYDKLVFMFDIGNVGDGSNTSTFYFDDVQQTNTLSTSTIELSGIRVYPNPSKRIINIDSGSNPLTKVEIYTLLGKRIKSLNSNLDQINIEDLSSGLYLMKLYSGYSSTVRKIMKE